MRSRFTISNSIYQCKMYLSATSKRFKIYYILIVFVTKKNIDALINDNDKLTKLHLVIVLITLISE